MNDVWLGRDVDSSNVNYILIRILIWYCLNYPLGFQIRGGRGSSNVKSLSALMVGTGLTELLKSNFRTKENKKFTCLRKWLMHQHFLSKANFRCYCHSKINFSNNELTSRQLSTHNLMGQGLEKKAEWEVYIDYLISLSPNPLPDLKNHWLGIPI